MNNAENIARLTDRAEHHNDDAQARPLTAGGESKILDAQTILDGAYNELVQSGTVEAGKPKHDKRMPNEQNERA